MGGAVVLAFATLATKAEETGYLLQALEARGATVRTVDLSLESRGALLDGPAKLEAMDRAVERGIEKAFEELDGVRSIIGLGGGTGGEVALRVMRVLPAALPKLLVTTLPFDPRVALADCSIILVPTLVDIHGLNPTLRQVFDNAATMAVSLCSGPRERGTDRHGDTTVGITALGATDAATRHLVAALRQLGEECTVFHANGYGGAALARFAKAGAFHAIVDLTPHELTRIHIAGAHVAMPDRFTAAGHLPRVLLPGGLNFIGLGSLETIDDELLERPHYSHSGLFTHIKVNRSEMVTIVDALADQLDDLSGPACVIVPMGGFSHQDAAGGAIEDPGLREVFLERARERLDPGIRLRAIGAHISSPMVTKAVLEELKILAAQRKDE